MTTELELYAVASTLVDTSNSSARVLLANLRGFGNTGEDGSAEAIEQCEVIFPYGFASRPSITQHTEALCAYYGDQMICLAVLDKSAVDISSLEEGEVRLQNKAGAVIRMRANGDIELTAASGRDIIHNGGSLKVARDTDPVEVTIPIGTVVIAATGATLNPTPITLSGTIKNGVLHVKA